MQQESEISKASDTYTLTWHQLSATVEVKHQQTLLGSIKSKILCDKDALASNTKTIIDGGKLAIRFEFLVSSSQLYSDNSVSGIARPGQLLAIMGASGAGKTTLLRALTQRNKGGLKLAGEVRLNGRLIKLNSSNASTQLSKLSGYIEQDDTFIGSLTVKEHLKFHAMLKLPRTQSYREKMSRVEEVLVEVSSSHLNNTSLDVEIHCIFLHTQAESQEM